MLAGIDQDIPCHAAGALATVLGAGGYIGSALTAALRRRGCVVQAPDRDADLTGRRLGTVFYCIGLTGDWKTQPLDTATAHVSKLIEVLGRARFDALVYLSSTRLYRNSANPAEEDAPVLLSPLDGDDLYGASKVLGECLTLSCGRGKVARLSNVYGVGAPPSSGFLAGIVRAALRDGVVRLETSLVSGKDYVSLGDVVKLLIRIGFDGRSSIYNVASGRNVSNREIAGVLAAHTGCRIEVASGASTRQFPPISIARARGEFDFQPRQLLDELPGWLQADQKLVG